MLVTVTMPQARKALQDPGKRQQFCACAQEVLRAGSVDMDLDSALLAGWSRCMLHQTGPHSLVATRQAHQQIAEQEVTIRDRIRGLWRLRRYHRDMEGATGEGNAGPGVSQVWRAWSIAAKLQACNRVLKKECRHRKTLRIVEAVQAGNIYRAAQRFAPKQAKKRLQLRSPEGHLQTHEAEHQQIREYYQQLFAGVQSHSTPACLPQDINIDEEEVGSAMKRLMAGKAMPTTSAVGDLQLLGAWTAR